MNTIPQHCTGSFSGDMIPKSTSTTFRACVPGNATNYDSHTIPSSTTRTTGANLVPTVNNDAPNRPLPPLPTQSAKGKETKKRGKRGAPPVQWTPSKERQFARLQQMTTVNIKDIPVVMRDDKLRFEKRHAQDKLSNYLGDRPNIFRPTDENEAQERIKQSYNLKMNLKENKQNLNNFEPLAPINTSQPLEHHTMKPRQISEYSSAYFDLGMPPPPAHNYEEELRKFALNKADSSTPPRDEAPEPAIHIQRSSFASFQSLERRMASRATKDDQQLTNYSSAALRTMLFVKRKLSIGSQRISWSSLDSTLTVTGPTPSAARSPITTDTGSITLPRRGSTAPLKKSTLSVEAGGRGTMSDVSPIEPFRMSYPPVDPLPTPELSPPSPQGSTASKPTSPQPPRWQLRLKRAQRLPRNNSLSQGMATQFTGKEDDDLMDCVVEWGNWNQASIEPMVSTSADGLAADRLLEETYFLRPPTLDPHHGLNSSDETSSLGPLIPELEISSANERLSISSEIGIKSSEDTVGSIPPDPSPEIFNSLPFVPTKARDCCHNLRRGDPRASTCLVCELSESDSHRIVSRTVRAWQETDDTLLSQQYLTSGLTDATLNQVDMFHNTLLHTAARTEEFYALFLALQIQNFNFFHLDDYGQTLLHVLTQYWVHSDTIAAAFDCMNLTAACKPTGRDFRGRTIDLQLQAQAMKEDQHIADIDRQVKITKFIDPKPSGEWYKAPGNHQMVSEQSVDATQRRLCTTVNHCLNGRPVEDNMGRNGLHCLAESFPTYNSDSNLSNKLKRKYQQGNNIIQHKFILDTVKSLCATGADVNSHDLYGNTPLMAFIKQDFTQSPNDRRTTDEVLQLLISKGANVHRRNRRGETALHIAMRLGRYAAVEVLLANHANVNARTSCGKRVLDVATKTSIKGAEKDTGLCARITACMDIAMEYGVVMKPDAKTEWDEQVRCYANGSLGRGLYCGVAL
ncbi:putative ankyrin repeat protein [Lachnellula occidentalis]|uniref:Putative ankyrin repeat protein n=1 Tax=Lachnellula occidentalis TaxID=215460 RepID=A0A8H8RJY0_9HELO|nr:putative ankyrin repeat protein [Lachnellula occidentalis]